MNILKKQGLVMAEKQRQVGKKETKEGKVVMDLKIKSSMMSTKEDFVIRLKKKAMMINEEEMVVKNTIILEA
jgi:hypothetical protein